MAQQVFNPTGTGRTGTVQYFTVPRSGKYIFVAKGAAGFTGSVNRSGTIYTPTPGKGAVVTAEIDLTAGDELLIVVGQRGSSTVSSVSDGSGGGSGGATWVFRKIDTITDSTYQTTINGVDGNWECLLCAAGGCGTIDAAYRQSSATAPDAAVTVYSLATYGTYKAFSTSTASISSSTSLADVVLSLNQIKTYGFQGAYYVRNSNYGYGGFGGGHAADDDQSAGGGWAISDTSYRAASWAKYGGTAEVNATLEEGLLTIELPDLDPPELTISSPIDQSEIAGGTVLVSGIASDPSGILSVSVNGNPVSVSSSGAFQTTVPLVIGSNLIQITATDTMGNVATETRTIRRIDVTPPAIDIVSPSDGYQTHDDHILIEGFASDSESSIVNVSLNGTSIEYDLDTGLFSVGRHLNPGQNTFTVSAEDSYGNVGFKTVVVTRKTYTPEELHPDNPQPQMIIVIDSVTLLPNPVATKNTFRVTASVSQRYVYPTVEALFEFPMDLSHTGLPLSNIVFS